MIIWLNGTFGVGKTTTATLISQRSRLRLFDPESVGYMLRPHLADHPVADFQHWPSWRRLTPVVADELARFTGQDLVAPQTVLDEDRWDELVAGLTSRGHEVFHVLLDADEGALRDRIRGDRVEATAEGWRLDHLAAYAAARPWMTHRADLIVDTTRLQPAEVADRVLAAALPD